VLGDFAVVGLEGAPYFPPGSGVKMNLGCTALYPDQLVQRQFRRWDTLADKALIILSHAPPYGVLDQARRHTVQPRSTGSRPLRDYILSRQNAVLCVCGHVHRWGRRSESLGTCTVVNAATHGGERDTGSVAEMVVAARGMRDLVWVTLTPNRLLQNT
jgi:Icc-related predicted phosphoesterase